MSDQPAGEAPEVQTDVEPASSTAPEPESERVNGVLKVLGTRTTERDALREERDRLMARLDEMAVESNAPAAPADPPVEVVDETPDDGLPGEVIPTFIAKTSPARPMARTALSTERERLWSLIDKG